MNLLYLLHRCFQDTRFHIISPAVLTLIYFLCFAFDPLEHLTATETHTNKQEIFSYIFFRIPTYFSGTITKTANLVNILVSITENNVDYNICQAKTSVKYSRSRYDGKSGEMTSSTRRGESRVLVRMPGCANLHLAVLAPPVLVS